MGFVLFTLIVIVGFLATPIVAKRKSNKPAFSLPPGVYMPATDPTTTAYSPTTPPYDYGKFKTGLWSPDSLLNSYDGWSLFSNDDDEEYSIGWSASWSPWDSTWSPWSPAGDSSSDFWSSGVDSWGSEYDSWGYYGNSGMHDSWNFMGGSPSSDWGMWSSWSPWNMYELINIEKYWTHHEELNWCKGEWNPEMTTDEDTVDMVEEFVTSGSITNWCIGPGQVLVLSDLRNRDLNDPNGLPAIFRSGSSPIICTEKVCQALLNQRDQLIPAKLTNMAWKIMEAFKAMDCVDCFCESAEKEEMESVLSITKDYLKKQVILGYNVTMETPREVSVYYQEMKDTAGLVDIPIDPNRNYIPLKTMDEAIKGPGSASQAIQAITELTHGIGLFCS